MDKSIGRDDKPATSLIDEFDEDPDQQTNFPDDKIAHADDPPAAILTAGSVSPDMLDGEAPGKMDQHETEPPFKIAHVWAEPAAKLTAGCGKPLIDCGSELPAPQHTTAPFVQIIAQVWLSPEDISDTSEVKE